MNAHDCALLSKLVYDDFSFKVENTEGLIVESEECVVIAFRGTESFSDWLSNFKLWPVKYPYGEGKIHRGLLLDVTTILPYILSIPRDKPLYLTGHSRGGGLAVVAARVLWDLLKIKSVVYTFGSMNIGDSVFKTEVEQNIKIFRFTNNKDVVTRLPFLMGYYKGCGLRIHQFTDGSIKENPTLWELSYDLMQVYYTQGFKELVQDHSMNLYVEMAKRCEQY